MNPYLNWINFYANTYGVDPELARRIALRESKFDPNAKSPAGAIGIMQLMPGTAKGLGVDPWNPEQNIKGGIKYYSQMRDKFGPVMGLAAYNWGEGNVGKYLKGDIKDMPGETQRYLAELGPYADKNQYHAPMSPTGQTGVPPEVMPVAAPEMPTTIPPAPTGERKMDDYEQMKIFNPYVQMALGILAGNSGQNKSQAFANAMQGGLTGLNAAQRSSAYEAQTRAQADAVRMKQREYELMQQRARYEQDWAKGKLTSGQYDPSQKDMLEMMASGNTETGIKMFNSSTAAQSREQQLELRQKALDQQMEINRLKNEDTGGRSPLTQDQNSVVYGWSTDRKGNVYAPSGAKVEGTQQKWAIEMADPRNAGNQMNLKSYEDKNNPLKTVGPANFQDWIDEYGNYLTEPTSVDELPKKGFRFVDKTERDDFRTAKVQLGEISTQWKNLFGKDGVYNTLKGLKGNDLERLAAGGKAHWASTGTSSDPTSIKIREWNKFVDRSLPGFAREVGHTGVLTQLDVESVKPSLGSITPDYFKLKFSPDTEEEMKNGLIKLYQLYASRGIRNKELDELMKEAGIFSSMTTKSGRKLTD